MSKGAKKTPKKPKPDVGPAPNPGGPTQGGKGGN